MIAVDERLQRGTEGLDAGLQPFEEENVHQPGNPVSGSEQVTVLRLALRFRPYVVDNSIAGASVLPERSLKFLKGAGLGVHLIKSILKIRQYGLREANGAAVNSSRFSV